MANNKKNCEYTIVYVYGPTRCKDAYMSNLVLNRENGEFVKIGKTDFDGNLADCTEDSLKKTAIGRCQQESKTGISDWCDIYDVFLFPQTNGKNVDDIIRNILCNDVYSLDNSKAEIQEVKGDIKPGREFVYGVSRNHIRHAVESYCFKLIIASEDNLEDIRTICQINAIMEDSDQEGEGQNEDKKTTRRNRDINTILSPGDVVYLVDSREKNKPVCDGEKQIEAVFVGNKKFQYNQEEPKFASPLAIDLINRFKGENYATINGNDCWMAEVIEDNKTQMKTLAQLYDATVTGKSN